MEGLGVHPDSHSDLRSLSMRKRKLESPTQTFDAFAKPGKPQALNGTSFGQARTCIQPTGYANCESIALNRACDRLADASTMAISIVEPLLDKAIGADRDRMRHVVGKIEMPLDRRSSPHFMRRY